MIKDRTAIAGIGQTPFGKQLPETELELACSAVRNALDDAGIVPDPDAAFAQRMENAETQSDLLQRAGGHRAHESHGEGQGGLVQSPP